MRDARGFLSAFEVKHLSDSELIRRYLAVGVAFGDALSYLCSIGVEEYSPNGDFEKLFNHWEMLELEYSRLGYRTISLDILRDFQKRKKIFEFPPEKRENGEEAILHA